MDKRGLYAEAAKRIAQGELNFPTSAQVALKLRQLLEDPDSHIEQAARLVQAEPLLAARVVALANSVAYNRSGREISDVRTAVSRLGFRTLRSLAIAVITRQLAGTAVGASDALAHRLWEHTTHVASLAHVIARRVTRIDPETAMFAGIVHEVAGFYLISQAAKHPEWVDDDPSDWLDGGEAEVGRAILKVLGVPDTILEGLEGYWEGFLAIPPTSLADTLLLAEELSPVASPLHHPNGRLRDANSASIDMQVGEETLQEIMQESAEEVRSLICALT